MDALDVAELLQRLQYDDHHDGGTVGVGDDTTGTVQGILGVALGHHEGHVGIHAESAGIVDHDTAVLRDGLSKLFRRAGTGRCEGDINILEIVVMLEQLHGQLLATEGVLRTGRTLGTKQHQFIHREISLIEQAQELLAYGA